jgi:glyoxylase-like metal-dependent hydrolase (beta-lactamase superfamily II)
MAFQSASKALQNSATAAVARPSTQCIEVAPDVAGLPLVIVNVALVGIPGAGDRSWVLIDAGLAFSAERIRRVAAERFGPDARPAAIILTHGHFDHVGALIELADEWDAPVYAHALEVPYLTGQSSYPPPDPTVGGGAMSFLSWLYPRGPIDIRRRLRILPADGSVPELPGWRWIATPGHTAGHISLFRDADRLLLAGDAFVTTKQESALAAVLPSEPHVHRPPAYYTTDWALARSSVEALARLEPATALTGHGLPISGLRLRHELGLLVRDWDQIAVPPRGRYVNQPAITDEMGVVNVPAARTDSRLFVMAGLGLAAVAGLLATAIARASKGDRG